MPEKIEKVDMETGDQLYVPDNMKEIFEISNKNRKKNKIRKKDTQIPESPQKPQPIYEIIQNQYKVDEKENGFSDFKAVAKMSDVEFMGHLGWTGWTERNSHSPLIKK